MLIIEVGRSKKIKVLRVILLFCLKDIDKFMGPNILIHDSLIQGVSVGLIQMMFTL